MIQTQLTARSAVLATRECAQNENTHMQIQKSELATKTKTQDEGLDMNASKAKEN